MKKGLLFCAMLTVPMALNVVAMVPNVVFLAVILVATPLFVSEALLFGGVALLTTVLSGVLFGQNVTTSLIQGFIVGL